MVGVVAVGAIRQQVLVLGVGHEQQPEQDHHHLFVRIVEVAGCRLVAEPTG